MTNIDAVLLAQKRYNWRYKMADRKKSTIAHAYMSQNYSSPPLKGAKLLSLEEMAGEGKKESVLGSKNVGNVLICQGTE